MLGPINAPDALTVTIAFGGSLFDGRYGLSARRPRRLIEMPNFPNDALDPARSNGDVLLQICAGQRDTVVHTLRELVRSVRGPFRALGDRRLLLARSAAPRRTTARATCSPSATAPPTRTSATPR